MRKRGRKLGILPALLLLLASSANVSAAQQPPPEADLVAAASRLLATLSAELRGRLVLPFGSEERIDWHYVPRRRPGISLKELSAPQKQAVHAVLLAGLSPRGYEKTAGVIELEGILREIETFGWRRDPELYFLSIFGAPSRGTPWGWRFEGHHLSLNFTAAGGGSVATTPAFLGANPAKVERGKRAGWRVLAAEEDLARRLLASLDPGQRSRALIAPRAPSDILGAPGRTALPPPAGLPASAMSEAQRELLLALVGEYVGNMRPELAAANWKKIRDSGIEVIRFAWAGAAVSGQGHYYRVASPAFVIEYDNTQDDANHVHSVWRDPEGDFGADLLRRHYARHSHRRPHPLAVGDSAVSRSSAGTPP
jgi:Protein of unknown function (DUF3500)